MEREHEARLDERPAGARSIVVVAGRRAGQRQEPDVDAAVCAAPQVASGAAAASANAATSGRSPTEMPDGLAEDPALRIDEEQERVGAGRGDARPPPPPPRAGRPRPPPPPAPGPRWHPSAASRRGGRRRRPPAAGRPPAAACIAARRRWVRATSRSIRSPGAPCAGTGAAVSCGRRCRRAVARPRQGIADAPDGPQGIASAQRLQLASQVVDVQVHDVGVDVRLGAPDRVQDLLPRHDAPLLADEVAEQRVLPRRQVLRRIAHDHAVADRVELDVARDQSLAGQLGCPPGERAQPGQQLREREWLGQVVVRARVQAGHPVVERPQRGEHQHRGGDAPRPEQAQHLQRHRGRAASGRGR